MKRGIPPGPFATARATPLVAAALLGGYLLWSLAFVVLYGLHGLACAFAADSASLRLGLAAVWLAHVAAGVALFVWLRRRGAAAGMGTGRFVAQVACTLALTGTAATAWTGLPLLLTRACEPPPRVEARAGGSDPATAAGSAHAATPAAADPRGVWNGRHGAGSIGRHAVQGGAT